MSYLFKKLHDITQNSRENVKEVRVPKQVLAPKTYGRFKHVQLPEPLMPTRPLKNLWDLRTSARNFSTTPITAVHLSSLAYATTGLSPKTKTTKRNAPSGGGLYPLEYYWVVQSVESIGQGVYHYHIPSHTLQEILGESTTFVKTLSSECFKKASLFLIITSMWERQEFKYDELTYRLALLEAGHVMQNVLLTAANFGLKSSPLLQFNGERVDEGVLNLKNRNENSLYISAFGL